MKIAIIGTGYVGLVSGTCFSEFGHEVICIDKDSAKISELQAGRVPIYEPGLESLVRKNVEEKRLQFDTDIARAVPWAETLFIAVGTPSSRRGDGYADLSYIHAAAKEIAPYLRRSALPGRLPGLSGKQTRVLVLTSPPTRNFFARVRPSTISCDRIASSLE
jgi:UDPglucose 6-dehydrogenase